MSNNKQSSNHIPDVRNKVKLYTEEQVKEAIILGFYCSIDHTLLNLTPIEIPSDEEIENASFTEKYQVAFNPFASGAKWMLDKIQRGNNEQQHN